MKSRLILAAGLLAVSLSLPALAQYGAAKNSKSNQTYRGLSERSVLPPSQQINASARKFMRDVAEDGQTEVKLGEIAAQKSSNQAVKSFAQRMVTDHTKAGQELMNLATTDHVSLPTTLDSKHQAMVNKLSRLSGAAFDSAYAKMMVQDHKKAVALFQERSNNGRNTDLRMWAANTLPTLREHLQMAERMNAEVNASHAHRRRK